MTMTVYISSELFAVEIMSGQNLLFREVCDKPRFTKLMEDLVMPDTYTLVSSVVGMSEYMSIGQLKNKTALNVKQVDSLNLKTYFNSEKRVSIRSIPKFIGYNLFFLGILIGILIMDSLVVRDMLFTREERIVSAESILQFNDDYSDNHIDGTALYAELKSVYSPTRIELFKIEIDGTVEIIFLHDSSSLTNLQLTVLQGGQLSRGASVIVDETVLYIYQLGGILIDN